MYDGYVLFCNKESQQQCLSNKHYKCAENEPKPLEEIKAGAVIFLFNKDDKSLVGPFTTLPEGDELDAGAWAENVENQYPYDDVKVTWEDLHILQNASEKLPFLVEPKTCKLTTTQVQRALDLLKESPLYLFAKNQ